MKDIDIAKNLLVKEQLALVIVKDGEVIFRSNGRGIKPLYMAVNKIKESLKGASVADKVIGKAAAMLCAYAEIKELHTNLISKKAIDVLDRTAIKYEFESSAPFIRNRDNTGLCPVETLSLKVDDIVELMQEIQSFLKRINAL